jgi:hypothetical protein
VVASPTEIAENPRPSSAVRPPPPADPTPRRPFLPDAPPLDRRRKRVHQVIVGLLLLTGLLRGTYQVLTAPLWYPVDEIAHFDYVEHLAQGDGIPTVGQDLVEDRSLFILKSTPTLNFRSEPYGSTGADANLGGTRHSYESIHGPTYYVVMVPAYWLGRAAGGDLGSIYLVRLATVALGLCVIPLTWLLARRLFPSRPTIWLLAAALVTMVNSLVGGAVSNDAMALVMATSAMVLFLRALSRPDGWRAPAAAGVLVGLTLVTKMTALVVIPFLGIAFVAYVATTKPPVVRTARWVGAAVGGAVLAYVPWLLWNLHAYGSISASKASNDITGGYLGSTPLSLEGIRVHADIARPGVWLNPMSLYPSYERLWETTYVVAVVLGIIAVVARRRWRDVAALAWAAAALPLAFFTMEAIVFILFSGNGGPVGRHLTVALAPTMVAIAASVVFVIGARWAPVAVSAFIVASLVIEANVTQQQFHETYLQLGDDGLGPSVNQDYSDLVWSEDVVVRVDAGCPVSRVALGLAGAPPPAELAIAGSDSRAVLDPDAAQLDEADPGRLTYYRVDPAVDGAFTIEVPGSAQLRASAEDRSPGTDLGSVEGDAVIRAFCPMPDGAERSFAVLFPPNHADLSLGLVQALRWILVGLGALAAVAVGASPFLIGSRYDESEPTVPRAGT